MFLCLVAGWASGWPFVFCLLRLLVVWDLLSPYYAFVFLSFDVHCLMIAV